MRRVTLLVMLIWLPQCQTSRDRGKKSEPKEENSVDMLQCTWTQGNEKTLDSCLQFPSSKAAELKTRCSDGETKVGACPTENLLGSCIQREGLKEFYYAGKYRTKAHSQKRCNYLFPSNKWVESAEAEDESKIFPLQDRKLSGTFENKPIELGTVAYNKKTNRIVMVTDPAKDPCNSEEKFEAYFASFVTDAKPAVGTYYGDSTHYTFYFLPEGRDNITIGGPGKLVVESSDDLAIKGTLSQSFSRNSGEINGRFEAHVCPDK